MRMMSLDGSLGNFRTERQGGAFFRMKLLWGDAKRLFLPRLDVCAVRERDVPKDHVYVGVHFHGKFALSLLILQNILELLQAFYSSFHIVEL